MRNAMRTIIGLVIILSVGACMENNKLYRHAGGSILNPVCAPDGSVVRIEYANSEGNYNGIKADKENCLWHN